MATEEGGDLGTDQRELLSQSGTFFLIILFGDGGILRLLGFLDFHFLIDERRDEQENTTHHCIGYGIINIYVTILIPKVYILKLLLFHRFSFNMKLFFC